MTPHADVRAAAGRRPLGGMGGVRSAVALLGLHEQDLVLGGLQYLDGFRHRRRVDPIFRVHEKPGARFDGRAVLSISAMTRSYMSDFGTCLPIGVLSSPRPKYPVNGFSQMTCFPACMASTIIVACSAGGVQISTTSISLSASRLLKSRCVVRISCFLAKSRTWSPRAATAVNCASSP